MNEYDKCTCLFGSFVCYFKNKGASRLKVGFKGDIQGLGHLSMIRIYFQNKCKKKLLRRTSSVDPGASSRRISRKKRKQADILETMADEVHESTVAQGEHDQIFANAISGKNEEVKMGEKLEQLGFAEHDAIHVVMKICSDPRLEKSF
ncbi:hypothetical protein PIB30_084181 [Stylosanthes scabra]|uniref:UBA domain-containing protein n=1 Tax=Stylosanthes scabra TaxID=79078 RepID=A0ABU6TT90_9FABA|nr:hypothetical protein [Stylosanthes scabra]